MKFSTRLLLNFATLASFCVLVALIATVLGVQSSEGVARISSTQWPIVEAAGEARSHVGAIRGDVLQGILSRGDADRGASPALNERARQFYQAMDRLDALTDGDERFVEPLRIRFQEYFIVAERILSEAEERSDEEIAEELGLLREHERRLFVALSSALSQQQSLFTSSMALLQKRTGGLIRASVVITGLTLLLIGFVAWRMARSLTRPLVSLRDAVRNIRGGDLDVQVETRAGGEIGELAGAFNAMARELSVSEHDRRAAEKMRIEAEAKYLQAQKMEAVGQLAGGVAHDFNNMLQVILGYGELLLVEMHKHDDHVDMMNEMLTAADRSKTLVSQLLAFSRRQVLTPERLEINEVIDSIAKMIRRLIGEHIVLQVISGSGQLMVHADRGQLEQVLMNLCVNARDAMPSGGSISIETHRERLDEVDPSWEVAPGQYVRVSISDNGIGMSEEVRERIFEPFFTTKAQGQGTGLGLATVYGIVLQHDGRVVVESEPGVGTTFHVYLPAIEVRSEAVEEAEEMTLPTGSETVLVVEDERLVREVAHLVLERAGYHVLTAENGNLAVEIGREQGAQIDLLLCDVVMPGMSGPEAAAQIIEMHPHIRCLFTSGYAAEGIHKDFVLDKDTQFVQKPIRAKTLLHRVREVLDHES